MTRNRPRLLKQSIWYFLRQDYEPRELVVIDDGDATDDEIAVDDRLRHVRLPARRSRGECLNIGYELSRGDLVAHWAEGDWIGAHRLREQVDALGDADACFLDRMLHYSLDRGAVCRPRAQQPLLATVLDRKARWRRVQFPASDREDQLLSAVEAAARTTRCDGAQCYVNVAHPGDAAPISTGAGERCSARELASVVGADADFYVELRNRRPIASSHASTSTVRLVAPVFVYDGFGSMGEYLALGMSRAGADVAVTPLRLDDSGTTDEFRTLLDRSGRPRSDEPTLCLVWWGDNLDRFPSTDLFVNTMWESSRIPAGWPQRLARSRAVIVPSTYVADVFRSCGVAGPIEVVAQGIDPNVYRYEERPEREDLVTLMVGVYVPRKNMLQGIEAWQQAFEGDPNAKLIIKSRFGGARYETRDQRIRFVDANETTRGIAHWYRQADVLMALGNEGFGLPLVEGMATGLPVVVLDSEGQADVCREAGDLVLPVKPASWERVTHPGWGDGGVRAIPSVPEVTRHLRWVAEHRSEAAAIGRAASRWARRHRDVWAMGPAVLDVMETHLRTSRPLRRRPALCYPGVEGGPADYVRHLAGELGHGVAAMANPPGDFRGTVLLHIEHSPEAWDDGLLTRLAQEARHTGVPVVVTEHSVGDRILPWEHVATALVVHVEAGAEAVRRRWPAARVEVVPPGCPDWTEPRSRARRDTVAIIGRPRPEHGWWTLLDALRKRRGIRLLAVRRGGADDEWGSWLEAAHGLAVETHEAADARAAVEVAAERAGVVVLWHDAWSGLGTCYQARIAMASGLPVMTSRAPQFDDLQDAVFRPESLADGLSQVLEDDGLRARVVDAAHRFRQAHAWSRAAAQHRALWSSLGCA